mgnify:CR=1 FL=1
MGLELRLAIRGDLGEFLRRERQAIARGTTSAIRRRTTALKKRLRDQVKRAGLGGRLANAIRSELIPDRVSVNPVGRVFSKHWNIDVEGKHPALISRELWLRVQERLTGREEPPHQKEPLRNRPAYCLNQSSD